jgi:acyl phosphate:glycerol-3-phosphate acyltransferase
MTLVVLFIVLAYLIGSIPTALWIGRSTHGVDVREHGSKNAGATNTFRILGRKCGWIVLTIDVLKGLAASSLPLIFAEDYSDNELLLFQISTSLVCIIGHIFPVFAQFRGGKGVASALGIIIGLNPFSACISVCIFLVVFLVSRYVSLGAIITSITYPFVSFFIVKEESSLMIIFTALLGLLVVLAHWKNIRRLMNGAESKMNLLRRRA